ncbi:hypothetical protein [Aestuariicoccus sp. MJ-SS9]|uniref:hypothetical protein n=1 Tax=Aestuariicoccus sp. MJ-SS9 TaxID=3079855 RepID=UPI00291457D7|nr:hypothetical protein [Aestuariicoccus sp. MJ-SS9]MDU8914047.1 hypothetical protein [Aestuariicoccus sp. MJ-SS9]
MKFLAALVALATPTFAHADDWHGIWTTDPSACQYKDMIGEHDPTPVLYSATSFIGYEVRCDVKRSERISTLPAWRITLSCMGEGMSYDEERLLMISEDGRLWEFDGVWEPMGFTRCE